MDFESTRFVGDPFLQQIYDDPDTGLVKMGPGDQHTNSVLAVQQALVDLGWPERTSPPVTENIAIGTFGPLTSRVVLTYKTHYNIVYPPGAPTGLIDAFVGPQTLRKLDVQIAYWDYSVVTIEAKIADLRAQGYVVDVIDGKQIVLLGHNSNARYLMIDNTPAGIFNTYDVGCFEVHGNIFDAYWPLMDVFGMPTTDEYETSDGYRANDFLHGSIFCDPTTGEVWTAANEITRRPVL